MGMWKKLKNLLPTKRRIVQLYFGLLLNANLKGFITGNIYQGKTKIVCAPGINCYSCPGAVGACPLGSLQGSFSADKSTIFYVCGILLLYAIMFGRMICGWICPTGLVQDLLYKVKTPKVKKSPVTRVLSFLKYVILVFFVLIVPIMYAFRDTPLPAFCKYICPAGTLEGGIGLLSNAVNESYFSMLGPLFTWKFLLMVSIFVGAIFVYRLFCRFLCPLGALYGLFNRFSFMGVKVKEESCVHCGLCINHCKVDIKHVGDQECIGCGECIGVCPTKAITWKGGKILLQDNESFSPTESPKKKNARLAVRCVTAVLALGVLVGALVYYWNQEDQTNPNPGVVETERGNREGTLCYDTNLAIVTADGDTGEVIVPTQTGKITIMNFWGTWCTPCVAELPYFDQIASEYPEDVTVIAIHSALQSQTAPEYIGKYYPESQMVFSWDTGTMGDYYATLGGRGTYPYTLVLDDDGIIVKVFYSSVTYEDLKSAVETAMTN